MLCWLLIQQRALLVWNFIFGFQNCRVSSLSSSLISRENNILIFYLPLVMLGLERFKIWPFCKPTHNHILLACYLFNLFHATGLFRYPLKTSKNQRFSVFRGYRMRSVAWNGLTDLTKCVELTADTKQTMWENSWYQLDVMMSYQNEWYTYLAFILAISSSNPISSIWILFRGF